LSDSRAGSAASRPPPRASYTSREESGFVLTLVAPCQRVLPPCCFHDAADGAPRAETCRFPAWLPPRHRFIMKTNELAASQRACVLQLSTAKVLCPFLSCVSFLVAMTACSHSPRSTGHPADFATQARGCVGRRACQRHPPQRGRTPPPRAAVMFPDTLAAALPPALRDYFFGRCRGGPSYAVYVYPTSTLSAPRSS